MRSRRVRNPNKATTRVSINRPNTYERLPRTCQKIICEQQPVHTYGPNTLFDISAGELPFAVMGIEVPSRRIFVNGGEAKMPAPCGTGKFEVNG